ncbi:MAG: YdcF family protein [Spirulina sp.]
MVEMLRALVGSYWPKFSWGIYTYLASAKLMTLTLGVLIIVALFAGGRRYRRRLVATGLGLLGAYWLLISPLFSVPATALLTQFVPADQGQSADAIVVLARPREAEGDRYRTAITMLSAGRAPQMLVMGRIAAVHVWEQLQQTHQSADQITGAVCVKTTKHEAESATAFLVSQGARRIILITDQPHMLRAWLLFKGYGFEVIPRMEPWADWVPHHERSFLAIREYLGLVSYALLGRFRQSSPEQFPELVAETLQRFPMDRCFWSAEQIQAHQS